MDSSYHVRTDVTARKDIFWGISVDTICKGEVLVSLVCIFKKGTKKYEVKLEVQDEALSFRGKSSLVGVLVSSNVVIWW